jgi:hypothetical protein
MMGRWGRKRGGIEKKTYISSASGDIYFIEQHP